MPTPNHKRTFILFPSSSAPWSDELFTTNRPVDLADFDSFATQKLVDGFRVGFNSAAGYQQDSPSSPKVYKFGFDENLREKKFQGVPVPRGAMYRRGQRGFGFAVGYFPQAVGVAAFRRVTLDEINNRATSLQASPRPMNEPPLGTPDNSSYTQVQSVTEKYKTKQDFFVSPPVGINASDVNSHIPDAPDYWKLQGSWNQTCNRFFDNKTYYDLSFTMDWPYRRSEFDEEYAAHVHEPFVDIKPSYNFYIREYENGLREYDEANSGASFPSFMLPNVYMFVSELDEGYLDRGATNQGSTFYKHITLDGRIPTTFQDIIDPATGKKTGEQDEGQHFQKFGSVINTCCWGSPTAPEYFSTSYLAGEFDEYKNIIFSHDNLNLLEDLQGKETLFPMSTTVEFATEGPTIFSDLLHDAKLTAVLTKWLIEATKDPMFEDWAQYSFPEERSASTQETSPLRDTGPGSAPLQLTSSYQSPEVYDLASFMNGVLYGGDSTTVSDELQSILDPNWDGTFLGTYREEIQAATEPQYALFLQLMMYVFQASIDGFVQENKRDFTDLLQNKQAYSETVLYCIEKTALSETTLAPTNDTQKIWFPNSSQHQIIKYVDTQVKYNTPYEYVVKAYQIVLGNKYTYQQNLSASRAGANIHGGENDENLWKKLCLFNEPCLKIIGMPIYNSRWDNPRGIMIDDTRPVPPDVQIIPFQGIDDKILIWLNGTVGDFMALPQKILSDDYPPGTDFNIPIRFKSDDPSTSFEIFRINERPTSYNDFSGVTPVVVGGANVPARSYTDTSIRPNRKYYYTFRTTDVHGKTSNPTVVYECELVKTDGFVHLEMTTIDMGDFVDLTVVKPFKKFLQIKPAYSQTILETDKLRQYAETLNAAAPPTVNMNQIDLLGDEIRFANPGDAVWNTGQGSSKQYKIRLHSKKSGRKIDFNIDFTYNSRIHNLLDSGES